MDIQSSNIKTKATHDKSSEEFMGFREAQKTAEKITYCVMIIILIFIGFGYIADSV